MIANNFLIFSRSKYHSQFSLFCHRTTSAITHTVGVHAAEFSIARIDFSMDFKMPEEFVLDPEHFISHSKTTRSEHAIASRVVPGEKEFEILIHFAGRKTASVTIGKMPGLQVIVYDKLREVIRKQNSDWYPIWGIDPKERNITIYRVELRASKRIIKD